ncbi:DUF4145 domain-containing protein [Arthrobacter sp. 31Y]|uniref:DUF4145 domain-containing protein n=1 Tax=Arthrobacter sp. 31Y TaxID=1115632 RepID=UPI0004643B05|nr:DUF4145 domain-containing protein [Arthrobacter sp. 31Y]
MTVIGTGSYRSVQPGADAGGWYESTFVCDNCGRLNVGGTYVSSRPANTSDTTGTARYWSAYPPSDWAPAYVQGQDFPDVPEHVATPASEAHKCRSIGALMSSILMARAVIESVAKDHGITTGTLYKKIDAMHAAGLIDAFAKETAHTVRVFGNDMAHGDFTVKVDATDADGVLTFMDYILHGVYQSKAQLQRLKDSAAARAVAQNP